MSLLSVIVPIYNGSKFICETIDMILASEYKDLEVIAVNDGSTDDSAKLVSKMQEKDSRVKLFTKENGGVLQPEITELIMQAESIFALPIRMILSNRLCIPG